jgi:hypothetical protein
MLKYEFKKIIIKQHFLIIIAFIILLKIITLCFTQDDNTFLSVQDERIYNELLNQIGGKLTDEKELKLNNELDMLYSAKKQTTKLYNDLISGEYADADSYSNEYDKLLPILQKENSLIIINDKFLFANNDREHRWILSQSLPIIETNSVDFILLIFILLSSILIYYQEENTNMLRIIKTNKYGCKSTSHSKILLLFLFVVLICIIFSILELSYCIINLKHGEIFAPIQSLSFFSNSSYDITVFEGFLLLWTIKIIGYLFVSFLCSIILLRFKNPVVPLSFFLGLYIIEPFALNNKRVLYYTPFSLIKATGFLRGNAYKIVDKGMETEKTIADFKEINLAHFITVIIITAVIILLLMQICYRYYYRWKVKLFKPLVFLLIFIMSFTGCMSETEQEPLSINLSHCNILVQNNNSYFFANNGNIEMVDKKSGNTTKVIHDPFSVENQNIKSFACKDTYFYYLVSTSLTNEIYRINLENFSQESIFSQSLSETDAFLGLTKKDISFGISSIKNMFVCNNDLYFTTDNGINLYSYNIQSEKIKSVLLDGIFNNNISITGQKIYYLNSLLQLKCYNIESKENNLITDKLYNSLYIYEDKVLVANSTGIYCIDQISGAIQKVISDSSCSIAFDGENVLYLNKDRKLFLSKINGEKILLCANEIIEFEILNNTRAVIYSYLLDNKICNDIIKY